MNTMEPLSSFQNPHLTLLKGIKAVHNFHYTLNAGTALGLYRDGDLIPEDTDIDVIILADRDNVQDIQGIEGFKPLVFNNDPTGELPVQRAFTDEENDVVFDIYYYYRTGDMAVSPYAHDLIIPLHLYENRRLIETKYGNFYFPSPIEEYLEVNYGADWRIPKVGFKGIFAP